MNQEIVHLVKPGRRIIRILDDEIEDPDCQIIYIEEEEHYEPRHEYKRYCDCHACNSVRVGAKTEYLDEQPTRMEQLLEKCIEESLKLDQ